MGKDIISDVMEMARVMKEAAAIEVMPRFMKVQREYKDTANGRETVTEADRKASDYILSRRRLVRSGSFSEEDINGQRFLYNSVEMYDPVDGTDEFLSGSKDGFAMHGALLKRRGEKYKSVGGVIYVPGTETLWYGDGSRIGYEVSGKAREMPPLRRDCVRGWLRKIDTTRPTGFFYREGKQVILQDYVTDFYRKLGGSLGLPSKCIMGGGSGASFSDLLSGKTNIIAVLWDDSKEWDIAMAEPLIKARGGFLCDFEGSEYSYNRKDHLNRNGFIASIAFKKNEIIPLLSPAMVLTKKT